MSLGLNGAFWPMSLPLFYGSRRLGTLEEAVSMIGPPRGRHPALPLRTAAGSAQSIGLAVSRFLAISAPRPCNNLVNRSQDGTVMEPDKFHLRSDVRVIPLVNRWYAWAHLVSPLTFALTFKRHHVPLLSSFVEAPAIHIAAARDLKGGPFIDFRGDPAVIHQYLQRSLKRCGQQMAYADALADLFENVKSASGESLFQRGVAVPQMLRGLVDMAYNSLGMPTVRVIEHAWYRSPAYDPSLQSCILEPVLPGERAFVLATPMVQPALGSVDVEEPFSSELWDWLLDPQGNVSSSEEAVERLGGDVEPAAIAGMLQRASQPVNTRSSVPGMRIRYYGHACLLIEAGRSNILVDPLVSYPGEATGSHLTLADLPPVIDHVLITHGHQDHLVIETLLRLRHRIRNIVVPRASGGNLEDVSLRLLLQKCGFRSVQELGEYESLLDDGIAIHGLPFFGEHGDLDVRAKLCYLVSANGNSIALFADSKPPAADCYRLLLEMVPKLDAVFLGMECVGAPASWLYGPVMYRKPSREHDNERRLSGSDFETARAMLAALKPAQTYIYAMGAEAWITHLSSICYSEDLPQFREARRLVTHAHDLGQHCELLFGHKDISIG
jgi:L-ascorbate metabolism protein UlaG (beta-lactamase superfamily)